MVENQTPPQIESRTFTGFWELERKFYSVYDINLPVPVSLRAIGVVALSGAIWWGLMWLLQVPATPPFGWLVWIVPPFGLAYLAGKPWFQKKTLFQWVRSQIAYVLENKNYKTGLTPDLNKYNQAFPLQHNILVVEPPKPLPFS